jgi:hypothetical protein
VTLQPEGALAADQFKLVPVVVVEDAARPLGALGTAEQLAPVLTLTAELCAESPNASLAATVKLYVVPGDKPVTAKLVLGVVPIDVPFS